MEARGENGRFRIPRSRAEAAAALERAPLALRCLILALENFLADLAHLRAAALTYTTLLSLVPVLAFGFALLKGLGFEEDVLNFFLSQFFPATSPETYLRIQSYIARVNVKTVGVVGLAAFLVAVVLTIDTAERSLNVIFGVRRPRSLVRKFTDYFSIVLLTPLLFGITVSATTILQLREWLGPLATNWIFSEASALTLKLVPLAGAIVLFALVLLVLPNTVIRPLPALVGGGTGGVIWYFLQWGYVRSQFAFARYEAIYGALAQLPILMVWLYLAWCTLFFAAELAALAQGGLRRRAAPAGADPSALALRTMVFLARRSAEPGPPPRLEELSRRLDAPSEILETVVDQLEAKGFVCESREEGLLLSRHPAAIRAAEVLDAFEAGPPPAADGAASLLAEIERDRAAALGDVTLEQLRDGAHRPDEGADRSAPGPPGDL